MKMRDEFSQLGLLSRMLRWNTFMRLQLMPFMKCWWILEQRDVFVLLSGREMRLDHSVRKTTGHDLLRPLLLWPGPLKPVLGHSNL